MYYCVYDASELQHVVLSHESVYFASWLGYYMVISRVSRSVGGHVVTSWSGLDGLPHSPCGSVENVSGV